MLQVLDPGSYTWNTASLVHALGGALILLMGLATVYRERGTRVGRLYLYYTLSLASWIFAVAANLSAANAATSYSILRLGNAAIAFIPAIFFHFTCILLDLQHISRRYIHAAWIVSSLFAVSALTSDLFLGSIYHYSWGWYAQLGSLGVTYSVYFGLLTGYTIRCYAHAAMSAQPDSVHYRRTQTMLLAFLIGVIAAVDFLPALGLDVYPVGFVFIVALFGVTTFVTWRYRLVDITPEYAADNLLQIIQSPLLVLDLEGNVKLNNQAASAFLQECDRDALISTLLFLIESRPMPLSMHNQAEIEFEFRVHGQRRIYSLAVSPLLSRQRTLIAHVCLLHDITEQRQAAELLRQARDELEQRVRERTRDLEAEIVQHKATAEALTMAKELAERANQAKTAFLSRISHELRTPLNAILGFAQLMQMDEHQLQNPDHPGYLQKMLQSGEHLLTLITDVLDYSRIEIGQLHTEVEPLEVHAVMEEALHVIETPARMRGISINNHLVLQPSAWIIADASRVKQVLLNILSNAVKYNRDHGTVTIDCLRQQKRVRITVTDTGVGIAHDQRDLIFKPFEHLGDWRHHTDGAGIGLALSQRLVYEMDGDIDFQSEPGVGTTFWVEFPEVIIDSTD